jgi:hypothetical protein
MTHPSDTEALAALYAADRAELSSLDSTTTNLIAVSIAYITATIALLPAGGPSSLNGWVMAAVPLPIIVVASYWLSLLCITAARAVSARHLEALLRSKTMLSWDQAHLVGLEATEPMINIGLARGFQKLLLAVHYAGASVLVGGHAVVMLVRAWSLPHGSEAVITMGSIYLLVGGCCVGAVRSYGKHLDKLSAGLPPAPVV